jgi:hypothetical protein
LKPISLEPSATVATDRHADSRLPGSAFRRACRRLDVFGCLEQAILVSNEETVAGDWSADPSLAAIAAEHIRRTCDAASPAVQIQYTCLQAGDDGHLLYVKPAGDCLVALVAHNDVNLSRLRRLADCLAESLARDDEPVQVEQDESPQPFDVRPAQSDHWPDLPSGYASSALAEHSYAIAWRPVEPLPLGMRKIIQESARRLARREGCQLRFIGVASDHVHLVLQCPSRRKGSWVAHAFKRGIEQDIANRFGTSACLWQKGYLADASADPLGGEELLAYLSH